MASLCSLSFPHHYTITVPKLPRTHTKPTFIVCKSTAQDELSTHQTASVSDTHFEDSVPGPEGTGPAALTRGQRFLERQRALEAAKLVAKENSRSKEKKTKKEKPLKVSTAFACCYGCGAPLQTSESDAPGYVDSQTYELKKKHHQLRTVLCGRCRLLSHGHMITAVGGNGGYAGGKQFVTAEELREKLSYLRHEKVLILKLVDIVDFSGSFLVRVRDLAGANPIILVVTKVDLLPKGTDLNCIGDWVVEATTKKKLNVLSVHLTSSKSMVGISGVASEIQKEKKGRDVYILVSELLNWNLPFDAQSGGSANVGKSAFINALLKKMAQNDPAAAVAQKYKPIQSAVPGTTLGPIQINAFLGGGKLYDTPGVHLHHRQAAVVHSDDLPILAPQSRLRGHPIINSQEVPDNGRSSDVKSNDLNGFSIFWGGLVRIDILKVLPETCLTFYGPKALQIHIVPTDKADEFYQKELGVLLVPPTGKERADGWKGLETERQLHLPFVDVERPVCDIAISGLGWITVEPMSRSIRTANPNFEGRVKELHLSVHVPKQVEVFVRPPMPVAKVGAEWYQYRELTEKEEEARPKWFF